MAILTATDQITAPVGYFLLRLTVVEVVEGTKYGTTEPENQFQWAFRVERALEVEPSDEQAQFVGEIHREWTSMLCTPNSKSRAFANALLGREMRANEALDTDDLVGKYMKAMFGIPKNGTRVKVVTATPYTGQATPAGPASAAEMSGKANGDQSPADTPLAALRAAYAANVGAGKKWSADDATQLLRDLYGVDHSSRLQPDQMVELTNVLNDTLDVAISQEGKYVIGLPF